MSYSLNTTIINSSDKQKPENAVILCHGYGGDGKDISILANYWKNYLPRTVFICPDAPERCTVSPTGFQWFDLMDQTNDEILTKSLVAEIKLNNLIDEVKSAYNFVSNKYIQPSDAGEQAGEGGYNVIVKENGTALGAGAAGWLSRGAVSTLVPLVHTTLTLPRYVFGALASRSSFVCSTTTGP